MTPMLLVVEEEEELELELPVARVLEDVVVVARGVDDDVRDLYGDPLEVVDGHG